MKPADIYMIRIWPHDDVHDFQVIPLCFHSAKRAEERAKEDFGTLKYDVFGVNFLDET